MHITTRVGSVAAFGCLTVLCLFVIGCASPKAALEPPTNIATPAPVVAPVAGPPPDYVAPTNYWVREKIILTSEPAPSAPAPQRHAVKQGKQRKKTSS
jgi:hypothetical protein